MAAVPQALDDDVEEAVVLANFVLQPRGGHHQRPGVTPSGWLGPCEGAGDHQLPVWSRHQRAHRGSLTILVHACLRKDTHADLTGGPN